MAIDAVLDDLAASQLAAREARAKIQSRFADDVVSAELEHVYEQVAVRGGTAR
jgi:hypothetical protein